MGKVQILAVEVSVHCSCGKTDWKKRFPVPAMKGIVYSMISSVHDFCQSYSCAHTEKQSVKFQN